MNCRHLFRSLNRHISTDISLQKWGRRQIIYQRYYELILCLMANANVKCVVVQFEFKWFLHSNDGLTWVVPFHQFCCILFSDSVSFPALSLDCKIWWIMKLQFTLECLQETVKVCHFWQRVSHFMEYLLTIWARVNLREIFNPRTAPDVLQHHREESSRIHGWMIFRTATDRQLSNGGKFCSLSSVFVQSDLIHLPREWKPYDLNNK